MKLFDSLKEYLRFCRYPDAFGQGGATMRDSISRSTASCLAYDVVALKIEGLPPNGYVGDPGGCPADEDFRPVSSRIRPARSSTNISNFQTDAVIPASLV
jgi:hypothetical protein